MKLTKKDRAVFKRAADLLSKRGAWTKGKSARNKAGEGVWAASAQAVSWCLMGAIEKVGGGERQSNLAVKASPERMGAWWNDRQRSKGPVVRLLRKLSKAREVPS